MRNQFEKLVAGLDDEAMLTSMAIHALHLARVVLVTNKAFGSDDMSAATSEVGANFIRSSAKRSPLGWAGVLRGLSSCARGDMLEGINPKLPLDELAGKCLMDLELSRAVLSHFQADGKEIERLEKVITEVKSNIPLNVLEHIETGVDAAVEQASRVLTSKPE